MKVGIDVDGVLRDWASSLSNNYRLEFPRAQVDPITKWKTYDITPYFKNGMNVRDFFMYAKPYEVYVDAKPYSKAAEFVEKLKKRGHDVHIVSYQPTQQLEQLTTMWLHKNNITGVTVHYTKDKHKVGLDVMLDDCTDMLAKFNWKSSGIPVCMDKPWNQDWKYLRVNSFNKFVNLCDSIRYNKGRGWNC